jgi:coenzyme F420 hydrogenase subunit beta
MEVSGTANMASTIEPITTRSTFLARVAQGNLCAGCGGCAGLSPDKVAMEISPPGFLRPRQTAPLTTEEEARIARICPGLGQRVAAEGRKDPVLWGPYVEMLTGWAANPDLRFAGASGGALSALVAHLLESGTVDAVVQIEPDPRRPLVNRTRISISVEETAAAAGSRYAASAPLAGLEGHLAEHRATGRRFAILGKPCDAAALRALVQEDPEAAATFPVLLSFFCAGVPSHAGGLAVLAALGVTEAEVTSFRYRGNGWPGQATAVLADGSTRSMSYHDSWGGILSNHVQHRCKICADGTGMAADIVCADAWEADARGYPSFDDRPGVSLIVARTVLGQRLIAEARAAGRIETAPYDVAQLAAIQPGQRERRRALLARLLALRLAGQPVPHYEGLQIVAAARQNPLRRNLKNFLGTLRRVLYSRR